MDKTSSRQVVKLLLFLLGVIAFCVTYFSVRPGMAEKSTQLAEETLKLTAQLAKLTDLETNEATYSKRIKEYEQGIKRIINKYPAKVLEEDVILYAPEMIGKREMSISVVGISEANRMFGMSEQVVSSSEGAAAATDQELGIVDFASAPCPNYEVYCVSSRYEFVSGYEDMKTVFEKILTDPDKRNVPKLSLTYESESGMLVGNFSVDMYFMTGTDRIYHEPDAGVIVKGRENIFGTITPPAEPEEEAPKEEPKKEEVKNKKGKK